MKSLLDKGSVFTCPSYVRNPAISSVYDIVHYGIAYGSWRTIVGNGNNGSWLKFKDIKGKPVSHQLLYGDNNDQGAGGTTDADHLSRLYHNNSKYVNPLEGPGKRHNGRANYVWADGHISSRKPSEMYGITNTNAWTYNGNYYMYYWLTQPIQ